MKVHYINILLFSLPLNILAHNKNKPSITPHHTPTTRLLWECDIYMPNYDNDPQMKEVMEYFNKQTQQRFHEYNERIQEKRKQCKERCDKEIEKIILKDKLEKELMDKIVTLDTDIQSDAIPTCVCKQSLADQVEKTCLKCGGILGGGIAPGIGLLGTVAVSQWINAAILAAVKKGTDAGIATVVAELESLAEIFDKIGIDVLRMINKETYRCPQALITSIYAQQQKVCGDFGIKPSICYRVGLNDNPIWFGPKVLEATAKGIDAAKSAEEVALSETTSAAAIFTDPIVISAIVIVCIALILLIIYLILRYRRKKKMNKRLKYIKLFKE
ncbi:hypothetical protein PFBG_00875 [Plasmodium falciparum 7G8]|uniref:Rifin n=1 Tax=Plasmodium falciparum (isolate 7G8) TaxID=57266 RepID=W7FCW6_PLAF8|nr:hypothetical protein PFBG_00875 [Plasmodium falciparum 7G8]